MASRPGPDWTSLLTGCAVKLIAATLLAINVVWHGMVALFIGGPVGLVGFLLVVATLWVFAWVTMRRFREASADAQPDPLEPRAAEKHADGSVETG